MSRPLSRTVPAVLASSPVTTRDTVDLPAPLEPIRAVTPRSGTVKVTSKGPGRDRSWR